MQTQSHSPIRKWFTSLPVPRHEPIGVRYALRIAIGMMLVWIVFKAFGVTYPIWAIISVVMVSEIELHASYLATRGRIAHTAAGCAVGLIFLAAVGTGMWQLCAASAIASLLSFYLIHLGGNWRTAPVATVLVMATGIQHLSKYAGYQAAIERTLEVLGGSIIALAVTWVAAKLWPAQVENA
ncbi:MAG: FUSC family protein [Candidatus Acidiferrales bacterium]